MVNDRVRAVLRSREFDDVQTPEEAHERAQNLIGHLNGIFQALSPGGKIKLDGVGRIQADGSVASYHVLTDEKFEGRSRMVVAVTGGAASSGPSQSQKWWALSAQNDFVADMLVHCSKDPSWYDLFKAYEGVEALAGGSQDALKAKSWAPSEADLRRFTHTANFHRHAFPHPSRKTPPANPMSLSDATAMILRLVNSVLNERAP